jgi:hypothetical protein
MPQKVEMNKVASVLVCAKELMLLAAKRNETIDYLKLKGILFRLQCFALDRNSKVPAFRGALILSEKEKVLRLMD